ncbi:hypothetical protein N8766_03290 [bacterium]|nr:hypothetical protein [bacterium]
MNIRSAFVRRRILPTPKTEAVEDEQRSVLALWDRGRAFSPKIGKTAPRFQTHPLPIDGLVFRAKVRDTQLIPNVLMTL